MKQFKWVYLGVLLSTSWVFSACGPSTENKILKKTSSEAIASDSAQQWPEYQAAVSAERDLENLGVSVEPQVAGDISTMQATQNWNYENSNDYAISYAIRSYIYFAGRAVTKEDLNSHPALLELQYKINAVISYQSMGY